MTSSNQLKQVVSNTMSGCGCCGCIGLGRCSHTGPHWYCWLWTSKKKLNEVTGRASSQD
jgi:hypothetical protein